MKRNQECANGDYSDGRKGTQDSKVLGSNPAWIQRDLLLSISHIDTNFVTLNNHGKGSIAIYAIFVMMLQGLMMV